MTNLYYDLPDLCIDLIDWKLHEINMSKCLADILNLGKRLVYRKTGVRNKYVYSHWRTHYRISNGMKSRYDGYEVLVCEHYDFIGRGKLLEHISRIMYNHGSWVAMTC